MKRHLTILTLIFSVFAFSQTNQKVKNEILKLREEGDNIFKNFNEGSYCKYYFPEWQDFAFGFYGSNSNYGYGKNPTIQIIQSDISFLESLKTKYLRPNGAYNQYMSNYSKMSRLKNEIRQLENSIDVRPYPLSWSHITACEHVIRNIERKIKELKSLQNDLEIDDSNSFSNNNGSNQQNGTNTSNLHVNNKSTSNNQYNSSDNSPSSKTNQSPNTQNPEKSTYEQQWEESQRKIEESSRQYEQKQETINNIADAAGEFTGALIQSGIFNSNPYAKARRIAKRNKIEIISDFNNGLAVAKKGFDKGGLTIGGARYGFIDDTGEMVIPPTYGNARSFSEGLAPVKIGITTMSKWCFINETGEVVIPKKYSNAYSFINGEALVIIKKKILQNKQKWRNCYHFGI